MKRLHIIIAIIAIFAILIIFYSPSRKDFENTIETNGVIIRLTNGKTSSSTINGHLIYPNVGVFGGGGSVMLPEGVENKKNITAHVAVIKSLLGSVWFATKIESATDVYYMQTPSQCVAKWWHETLVQTIQWLLITIGLVYIFTIKGK
jgi:hypothetical protein